MKRAVLYNHELVHHCRYDRESCGFHRRSQLLAGVDAPRRANWRLLILLYTHTVLRSVITRTIDPAPAISTSFSCQLSSTLIACPPPSPPPLDCICENPPVAWGVRDDRPELGCEVCDIPLYLIQRKGVVSV